MPQLWVHAVQAEKAETTQWPGHAPVLHARCSVRYGHAYPPKVAAVVTLRARLWVPEPHDLVQVDHAPNADTTQCPAQSCVLHARCSVRYGQAYPPKVAAVVTLRARLCSPEPHDLVQADHAPNAETTQWPAQA